MQDRLTYAAAPGRARLMSRRQFFKVAAASGVLLAAGGGVASWIEWMFPAPLLRSSFAPRLGETFQVRAGALPVALQLVAVRPLGAPAPAQPSQAAEQSFAISFRGPAELPLGQGTYEFAHGQLGRFPLFIVPMAEQPGARYYQAIFNRQLA